MSGQWQVFEPAIQRIETRTESVRLNRNGVVVVSREIAARLGNPYRVVVLTNGAPHRFGVRAATQRKGSRTFRDYSGRARCVSVGTVVRELGKFWRVQADLPHSWEDDVLVIDVSGLPDLDAPS